MAADIRSIGTSAQQSANQTNALPTSFARVTQTASGMNTQITRTQQVMGATVTTVTNTTKATNSWTQVLKNNVLAIGTVAAGVVGLVMQYTQLQKAQLLVNRAEIIAETSRNRVIDLTNRLQQVIAKYGQNSTEAAKAQRDLAAAQEKSNLNTQRADILQTQFNERLADFAVNLLPTIISTGSGVIQVIQGFRTAEQEVAAVTTITGEAMAVQNAQMALAKTGAGELSIANDGLAASEIATGEAATVAGSAMRTALIRTGIGALLVAAGTALVAFTQNWWGFRDAVNNAGVEIGKFIPVLTPLLNILQQVGGWMNKLFGTEIPDSAGKTVDAMGEVTDEGSKAAAEAAKWAQTVADSWQKIQEPFLKLIDDHKWKQLIKNIKELGFSGAAAKKIKVGLDVTFEAQDILNNLQTSLSFISEFHLNKKDTKQWAKNTIGDMTAAIKEHPELKGIFQPIIDIIKQHKNDPGGMAGAIADLLTQNPQIAAALQKLGIKLEPEVVKIGNDWGAKMSEGISTGMQAALSKSGLSNAWFQSIPKEGGARGFAIAILGGGGEDKKDSGGDAAAKSFSTSFVESLKSTADVLKAGITSWITTAAGGLDTLLKGLGAGDAAWFTVGWESYQEVRPILEKYLTDALSSTWETLKGLGAGAASYFAIGWKAFTDMGNTINSWIAQAQAVTIPTIQGLGAGAAAWFSIGWQSLKKFGSDIATWVDTQTGGQLSKFFDTGVKIGGQIVEGIKSAFGGIGAGASGLWQWILNTFHIQTAEGGGPDNNPANIKFIGPGTDTQQQITQNNILARTIVQIQKDTQALTAANNTYASTVVQITKDVTAWIGANNIVAKTVIQTAKDVDTWTKSDNVLAKTIIQVGKDVISWTKDNNVLAKTIVQVKKDVDALIKSNNTLAKTIVQVGKDASSTASKLNDMADAARKAAAAARSAGSARASAAARAADRSPGGMHGLVVRSFAEGGVLTTHGPMDIRVGDNPNRREILAAIPSDHPMPALMETISQLFGGIIPGRGGGNGQQIVIPVSLNISGNSIINEQQLFREVRANIGNTLNMARFKH